MLLLTNKTIDKLKHDLVREGLVDIDGLTLAEFNAGNNGTNLATELVAEKLISETDLLNFIEDKLHIPFVELEDYTPDIECLKFVSEEQASKYNIFPLFKIEDVLTIAMADPLDLFTINTLFEGMSVLIEPVVCSEASIKKAIDIYYFDKQDDAKTISWQDKFITDNLSDELLNDALHDIIKDAISHDYSNIVMEYFNSGLNVYFDKELKGYIPGIIVPRFLYELKLIAGIDNDMQEFLQNSRFKFPYNDKIYSLACSLFPTAFGTRVVLSLYKPLNSIEYYNISSDKIDSVFDKKGFCGIDYEKFKDGLMYSLADYLSRNYSVLIVENQALYPLQNVSQFEFKKNTAIYFDEILNQIEYQKFDIVFWESVYTNEQFEKLQMLSNKVCIVTSVKNEFAQYFDNILN